MRLLSAICAAAFMLGLALSGPAQAQPAAAESQRQAREILMRMAGYLAGAPAFSVSVRSGYDAVQKSGQKIEFGETRRVTLSRPDKLRIEDERSDGTKTLTVFTGKDIVRIDFARNVYATAPQPGSVDASISHFIDNLGMRLPLSPLLLTRLPADFERRVKSVEYVEKTGILGAPAHHLAARTDTVDFQVWVADGDKPAPLRVVITYKKAAGQPQFWAQFADWNLAPSISDATFAPQPPAGAQLVEFATRQAKRTK